MIEKTVNLFNPGDFYAEYRISIDHIKYLAAVYEVESVTRYRDGISLRLREIDLTKLPFIVMGKLMFEHNGFKGDVMFPENQLLASPSAADIEISIRDRPPNYGSRF